MGKVEVGEVFTISDENNDEQEIEVLATMTDEGIEYVAVSFADDLRKEDDDDIDVFFLKIDEEGDFAAIESDDEFDKVSSKFDEMMDEQEESDLN
jgi:uncharacterized protein YrzB (UPF0473 family)